MELEDTTYRKEVRVQSVVLLFRDEPAIRVEDVGVFAPDLLVAMQDPWVDSNNGLASLSAIEMI